MVVSRLVRRARRMMSCAVSVTLVLSMITVGMAASAPSAHAAGTVLFDQPFHNNTVNGPAGSVSLPTAPAGTNAACLTSRGNNSSTGPLFTCGSSTDNNGSGKLRFTSATTSQEGGVFASTSVPTSQGLDVTFNSYQYGGTAADGIAFVLAAVNPANPTVPASIGQSGGALGYSAPNSSSNGLTDGYLGVGIDAYGNFSNKYEGSGCTDPANINSQMPGQVVVRGPGNGTVGYCPLLSSAPTATSPKLTVRATTRTASRVPVEVVFNPTSASVTTDSGLVVPAGDYDVTFTPVGGTAKTLLGALPVVPSGLYPSSWVNANGIPKQVAFGWVASTGGSTDFHEIDNVLVSSFNPVPQLAVSQTSYAASTLVAGSPVTYTVAASSSGAAENQPVTVTQTLPAGVVPVGASGTDWTCGVPNGQSISCTSTTTPFTSGTITVNAVVTSSSVTQAQVQSATSAVASSADGSPATSSSAPAGTVPSAPTITAITPTNGAAGGGNDVKITGTGLDAATAIEIGTTAQFTAGKPATLVLCASSAPGCFTVVSSTSLDISSMPAHTAGAVTVKVVTLGTSASTSYTYNTGPALLFPAPPGGEVNVAYSKQLTVTGGTSPFTWSVSSGSLPPGIALGASTGLLSGTPTTAGTYSFTVKVTDASGLTSTEAATVTIIPGPSMNFAAPPGGWTNTVYGYTLTETGGTSPYTWSVTSGSLPPGISLAPDGNLSGTPTATGSYSFTVKVTDANNQSATQATSISVSAGVSTTFAAPPASVVGSDYSYTLTATGGTTPYTWSVNAGSLPPGLTLSSAGVLSGTPTTTGSYPFSVNVIDANNGIATTSITLVVTTSVTFTFPAPPSGVVGTPYSVTLTAAGGTTPYTWSLSSGSLPPGLTLNTSTGVVSGTPTLAGTYNFTAKVTDAKSKTATFATSITILSKMLTVAVSATPATAAPGGTVTYTVTATNSGQTALTGATFTDPLTDVLDDAAYNNDAAATAGTVSFASPNLTWTGDLAVGAAATITFSVTVKNPDTGNKNLASTVTSTTASSNCASGSTDTRCSSTVGVSVLTIAMTVSPASPATVTPGATVGYTITVTNSGSVAYTAAALTDSLSGVLDDASYLNDASATAGSLSFASPNLTWTGNLAAGASATITFSVTVNNPDTGNKVLASTITSATAGSNCASGSTDSRCASTVSVLVPGLTMVVSAGTSSTTPGSVVQYTVTVTNSGQTPYTGAALTDSLSEILDDATYNGDASATSGSVAFASPNLTWTGDLAPGAAATITYSLTVKDPYTGDTDLTNTITSATPGSNCPASSTDTRCTSTVSVLVPGLEIAASAGSSTTTPGSVVQYTVTVTNSGQTPHTDATFTDPLSGVLDDAAYNGDAAATAGSVSFASPNLTWTGDLAPGASATITFSVTVNDPDTGNKILASTITSPTSGSNCAAGSEEPSCTTTVPVAVLTITNSSDVSTATPGSVVRFTAVFTNAGQTSYTGITIATNITNVLDDATPNGDQTATSGTLTLTSTGISWTGSIPVGGTVTVTGTVTVNNPDGGNKVMASTLSTAAAGSNCPSGGTDPRCSISVTVLTPALTIATTASATAAVPGQPVTVTVTVTDTGQTPYSGAVVTDSLAGSLDDAAYNNDASATTGSVSYAAPVLTWTGNLAVGASAVITYTLTVHDPDTGDKVIINTATSSEAGSACPPGATAAPCRVTVAVLTPALTIAQSAGAGTTTPGSVVHYTVTVTNSGQTPYTGAAFTDPLSAILDDAAYNGDAAATAGSVTVSSPNLTWTGDLAPGASATITFSVTVNNPDTGNKILASTITSATSGSNCAAGSSNAPCTATVRVAVLTIASTSSVSTATPGSVVRFTGTFTNAGQVAYAGITIAGDLTDIFDDASPGGDQTATSGTLSVTSTGITWTGSIPVGGSVTITGTVTINDPDAGNKVMASTLSTAAAGSNCPSGGTDPRCSVSVAVQIPALSITQTADATAAVPGQQVGFTVTIADTGPTPYTGITVTDTLRMLNDATYGGDAAATAGTVSYASPVLTWTGDLAPGATVTITFTATVDDPDTGDKLLAAAAASAAAGSSCPPGSGNTGCNIAIPVLTPALTITAAASASTATPGQQVTYTITVTDTGQTPYTGAVVTDDLTGLLDDAAYGADAAATTGTVSYASPNLTWTGNLDPGQAVTITYSVTVDNPDTGDNLLTDTVTSAAAGNNCPASGGTDPRCTATVTVVGVDTLTFTQSADPSTTPGSVVHYTVTVTNSGQTDYTDATFTDPLTGVLDDASYNNDESATAGSVAFASPDLTWTGTVPGGGTVTVTFSVTVNDPDTGNMILASTLTSASPNSDCPDGSSDPRCASTVTVSQLTITNSSDVPTTTPGSVVRFTAVFTNAGQTPYTGITIASDITNVLDDSTPNGDQTATSGTLTLTSTGISWTGSIPVGGSVTVTGTVTVNDPDAGNKVMASTLSTAAAGSNCPSGGTDPRCSVSVAVQIPALSITQTADATAAVPGQQVGFTVTIADTGPTPYTGITVTDTLRMLNDATYGGDAAATAGTVSYASPVLTWTGDLAPGATVTITFTATVDDPDTGDKLLAAAAASAAAGSSCPPGSGNTGCNIAIPVLTPALTITAAASASTATPGQQVTYTITVTDTGQTPYTGAVVTDDLTGLLDDAAYGADAAATTGTVSYASPNLTWTGNLDPGQAVTITYSVTVDNPDTGDNLLTNTVTSAAAGNNCPASGGTDPRCTATVTVAQLVIDSTADVSTTTPGGVVHYTTTLTNTGQTPYDNITMNSDASGLIDDAAGNGDQTATSGTFVIGTTGAVWTGDIPVGGTVTLAGSVTVNNPDTGNHVLTDINSTDAPGSNCPSGSTDPRCGTSIDVLTPGLTIVTTANATAAVPGQQVTFTVTVTDTGQTPYTGAVVTDSFAQMADNAVYNGDAAATTGALSYASPVLTWTGNLSPGDSAVITYTVTVNNPDTGDKQVITTATSADPGSTCPPGTTSSPCRATVPVLTPALTIVKTASTASATPGQQVTYTITVTDTGQTPYTGAVVTDDQTGLLDDAAYGADAAATSGAVSYASPVLTWTGNLDPGQAATITYTVTVDNPETGDNILTNAVTSAAAGNNCPASGGTDPRCAVTVPVATLTIVNSANVSTATPGSEIAYTITITNTGQVPYDNAVVTDPLSAVTDDAVAFSEDPTATAGSVSYASPVLTWTGDLEAGQSATVTFSVTVRNPDTGDKTITSTLVSTDSGSTCPPSGPAPACTSTVTVLIPALTLTKIATTTTTTPGSTVGYTVTVTDTGPTPYTAATVIDSLNGVLNDAAYNDDAAATSGAVSYASPDLTWTGDLEPGQAVTITYTVTVNNPDAGDQILVNFVTSTDPGSNCPSDSPAPGCTVTVTDLIPALTVTKTANTAAATPGSTVGYTITVHDTGQTPYTAATVTDSLTGILGDAAYGNDAAATRGTASYASPTLTWTGDLAPGDTATITYSVTVDNPDTGGGALSNTVVSTATGSTCPAGAADPGCSVTVAVVAGPLSMTVPATASLGSAAPGGTLSADLGIVQVTDDRGFGADWTATVSGTSFATGAGSPAETIPVTNAEYDITALGATTGSATFTPVPVTQLSTGPQPVVSATNVAGNTSVSWDPTIQVSIPSTAVGGDYTATITHSVS